MEALIPYLLKVNIAIIILYGFYRLFFQQDTFFKCKRTILLLIYAISLTYPLIDFSASFKNNEPINRMITSGKIPVFTLPEIIVTPEKTNTWDAMIPDLLFLTYLTGAILILVWLIGQLISIGINIHQSHPARLFGLKVNISHRKTSPYSFFHWIVLDGQTARENDVQEILLHEKTHASQWHTVDVVIAELMCAFCWFNPFVWLMKREIRMNLEFLADHSVIKSGYEREQYQFHILRLSYHKAAANLSNNFNFSPLKKRIQMMNKKQTSGFGYFKYLLFIPLVAMLLLVNNTQAVNETIKATVIPATTAPESSVSDTIKRVAVKNKPVELKEPVPPQKQTSQQKVVPPVEEASKATNATTKTDDVVGIQDIPQNTVRDYAEVMPEFPSGNSGLLKFLAENLRYPVVAAQNGIHGTVNLRFVVTKEGKVDNIEVRRSLDPSCDAEAIRAVKAMPNWIPGKEKGKAVDVYYNLPIRFKLAGDTPKKEEEKNTDVKSDVIVVGYPKK